jgi:hypothetical protein
MGAVLYCIVSEGVIMESIYSAHGVTPYTSLMAPHPKRHTGPSYIYMYGFVVST